MKKPAAALTIIIISLFMTACDDLVNGMDSYEKLSREETAQVFDEFASMGLNSSTGALTILPAGDSSGMTISVSGSAPCIDLDGNAFFPYAGGAWNASLVLVFNGCQAAGTDTMIFNGDIALHIYGGTGTVTGFDFSGTVKVEGPVEGRLTMDLHYAIDASCIVTWDCWEGSLNGYSVEELRQVLTP